MMSFIWFVIGAIFGALLLAVRLRQLFPGMASQMLAILPSPSSSGEPLLKARIEAQITEIRLQLKCKVDVERNQTRLAILREILGEDMQA